MSTPEIEQIVEYTKKVIEAATPIAKQAYEIGLVTLRIDAISTIVFCVAALVAVFFVFRKIAVEWREARVKRDACKNTYLDTSDFLALSGVPHFVGAALGTVTAAVCAIQLLNVWLYVKLFAPELWLAHMAVQKIVG